jgi:ATP-dependent Clp protease adaptor protein ClpS
MKQTTQKQHFHNEVAAAKKQSSLVLYNDEVNSFDFVIETLIDLCNHTFEQAEQCSIIIHYKGKYVVKSADLDVLNPIYQTMLKRGLTVTIE